MNDHRAIRGGRPLAERYEALREAALGGGRGPGLASVYRQGLWAWVELVRAEEDARARCAPIPRPPRISPPAVLAELVDVWASLALDRAVALEAA